MLKDSRTHLALVLAGYGALAAAVQAHCADLLTSDGECYLRMAVWYARGDVRHALFGVWSPLGPWLTVPLVALGMVPRYAFRVMIGLWGGLTVFGAWRLAGRLGMGNAWRAAVALCAALLAAEFSADHRVDLLLTGLLLLYLDASLDGRVVISRWRAFATGALGGLAYLAKLYALPFFAVHFPVALLCHLWARRWGEGWLRRFGSALGLGVAGFAVVAAPQVALLTSKYGRLTFGTAAGKSYTLVGPGSGSARARGIQGLRKPPPDAPNVWQDATRERLVWPKQGAPCPFSSLEAFARLVKVASRNVLRILGHFASLDEFRLGLVALAITPIVLLLSLRRREQAASYLIVVLALGVFCGGYALVQAANRRYFWFPMFVLLALVFHYLGLLSDRRKVLAVAGCVVAVVSFTFHPVRFVSTLLSGPPPGREHRVVAERLAALGVRGVLCSTNWWDGLHTAYYLGAQYAGMPVSREPGEVAEEMRRAGAKLLLVWNDPALAARFAGHPAFQPLGIVEAGPVPGFERYDAALLRLVNAAGRGSP